MKFNNNLAELIGLMFGDGCLSRSGGKYLIYISGHKEDDFRYHNIRINYLFLEIFGKKTKVGFRKDEKTLFTRFSDKKIFHSFSSLGMPIGKKYKKLKIPFWIVENKELICGFARGLADTDGCIVFSKQHRKERCYPRIEITSKSEPFLLEILSLLREHGFYGSVSNKGAGYRLEIPGFKNLQLWLSKVGFSNFKHIEKIEAQMGPLKRPRPDSNW